MRHAYGLIVFTIMAAASFLSVADVPKLITYQGWLTDTAGSPVADGNYSIRFQIYDASSGGNVKWNSGARPVSVTDGLFTHILGDSIPLPNTLFANDTALWLGVTVGVNPEFTPRTRLTSFGYAHQALRADTALYALNTIGGSYLPLSGGTMTGPITNTGDPTITMGKGNFGTNNINSGTNSFVAGQDNVASGDYATVGGGIFDTASGSSSTVPGGQRNTASGLLSFAAGSRAKAIHDYSFVWGSSLLIDFASTAERQFLIHASGGVGIGTNSPMEQLDITNPNTSGNSVVRTNRTSAFAANGLTLASAGVNEWSLRQPPTSSDNLSVFNHNLSLAAMEFDLANNNIGIGTNTPLINLSIFEDNDSDVGLRIHNPNVGAAAQEKIEFGNNAGLGIFGASNGMYVYNNRPGGTLGFEINSQYRLW
ncbi:MAG TPA: hypothetical protein VHP63_02270, partial [candidate division Zixibacteria bacterium]|nr:hypothetical protein [candidate division Zixibacteria bacterium]